MTFALLGCGGTDHARGAGRGIRRLARARAPDRGERLREGAERSETLRRGDGTLAPLQVR